MFLSICSTHTHLFASLKVLCIYIVYAPRSHPCLECGEIGGRTMDWQQWWSVFVSQNGMSIQWRKLVENDAWCVTHRGCLRSVHLPFALDSENVQIMMANELTWTIPFLSVQETMRNKHACTTQNTSKYKYKSSWTHWMHVYLLVFVYWAREGCVFSPLFCIRFRYVAGLEENTKIRASNILL